MSQSKRAAKSVFIITTFSIVSKILGFAREALIAAKFGSGESSDTFFIALSAIYLFRSMLTDSIKTTTIPVLSEAESSEGKAGKISHANNLFNIVLLISLILVVLGWFFSPLIIRIIARGFEGDQFKLAVSLMRIGLPAIIFAGIVGVFRGFLQSEFMFTESAAANLPFNFTYIFFLVFLSGVFGIKGLMVTSVLAVGAQILIQIPGVRKAGFSYEWVLDFKDEYVKKILYLVPPVLISVAINDVNSIIDKSLASTLVDGSISALNYAKRLEGLTTGIFISALTTVIYPMLSQEAHKEGYSGLKRVIIYGINIVLLITIPAMVGMIVLAHPIVRVAFERGAFNADDTYMTMGALVFYSIGLVGTALRSMLERVFYSLQDTKTPMYNGMIAVGVNVLFNLILIRSMAHRGLALATSISAIVTSVLLLHGLRKKIGSFGLLNSVKCGGKALVASGVMGGLVYLLNRLLATRFGSGTMAELISLLICASAGALVYFILIYLLRIDEVDWAVKTVKARLLKAKGN